MSTTQTEGFSYTEERFADIQLLRYRLKGFENLSLRQKAYIYCLAKATLAGRDITFCQKGKYNLAIRKTLEAIYQHSQSDRSTPNFQALIIYLKRVWFSHGIYHHYGCEKFLPGFSEDFFCDEVMALPNELLPLRKGTDKAMLLEELIPVIFDPEVLPKRVNQADGEDLVLTSACDFYESVTQKEAERFYENMRQPNDPEPPSYGLNSKLVKRNGQLTELVYSENGLFGEAIKCITSWLNRALNYTENEAQAHLIELLVKYYRTGNLKDFDKYSIAWVDENEGMIDFVNGFIEVYGDPLGLKGTWEGIVEYKDLEATKRTQTISDNAQWFEDHSPVNPKYRKPVVKGVTANVIQAAMLGGDEYPASAIGINLPNANWIRQAHGSKSVTIGNLIESYNQVAKGNGFREEFVIDRETIALIDKYGDLTDDLHTDLHECLGHGSGQLMPGVSPDALKAHGNTIEEARADLFGLYYIADQKLVDLGLLPDNNAYKAQYYTYLMNGLMTQLARIKPGADIEEAHMRNRSLIAHWVLEHAEGAAELVRREENGEQKTYLKVNDYSKLRQLFATLLSEIQRVKSEGDYEAARELVEKYAVKVNPDLHTEVLRRYERLNIAPYKGFINPWMKVVCEENGDLKDVTLDYTETYEHQMLRYSEEYGKL
jgi:dipeptidyl-peptidase-3